VDLRLDDIPAAQLVEEIQAETGPLTPPVVLAGLRDLTTELESEIRQLARSSVVHFAESNERLLDETVMLLHRAESELSEEQRAIMTAVRRNDFPLAGKKVLVVDDDVRNIFALTSVLEQHNLQVVHAEKGARRHRGPAQDAARRRCADGYHDAGGDGYETMSAIRQIAEFRTLPIIAVTAKAMKGDRAKCIEAGASDYITKPVDLEQLFSVLRVWLLRGQETSLTTMTARR
jgi:CheY-like chemotaxis protein